MTASLAAPAQILREVFKGTGVGFSGEPEPDDAGRRDADLDGLLGGAMARVGPIEESWKFALSMTGFAGGAFLIAVVALVVSWQSLEKVSSYSDMMQAIDAGLAELPPLKAGFEIISAEVKKDHAAQQRILEVSTLAKENADSVKAEVHQSLEAVNLRIDHALVAEKAQDAELSARMVKVEADQTAQAQVFQSLHLRTTTADRLMQAVANPGVAPLAGFHLRRIRGGIATVEGPDGMASVSVGDTLSNLGKVLRIGKRGRWGVLAAERGKLIMSWPRVHTKRKVVAGAN